MENCAIAFIGCGNMARSLIGGLIANNIDPSRLIAADPDAGQRLIASIDSLFVIQRRPDKGQPVTCVHNVAGDSHEVALTELGPGLESREAAWDIIDEEEVGSTLCLEPYQCRWLI